MDEMLKNEKHDVQKHFMDRMHFITQATPFMNDMRVSFTDVCG